MRIVEHSKGKPPLVALLLHIGVEHPVERLPLFRVLAPAGIGEGETRGEEGALWLRGVGGAVFAHLVRDREERQDIGREKAGIHLGKGAAQEPFRLVILRSGAQGRHALRNALFFALSERRSAEGTRREDNEGDECPDPERRMLDPRLTSLICVAGCRAARAAARTPLCCAYHRKFCGISAVRSLMICDSLPR